MNIKEFFDQWSLVVSYFVPIALAINVFGVYMFALWVTKQPRWSLAKAIFIIFVGVLIVSLLWVPGILNNLKDPNWATHKMALDYTERMLWRFVFSVSMFIIIPQVLAFILKNRFNTLFTGTFAKKYSAGALLLTTIACIIYIISAVIMSATPD